MAPWCQNMLQLVPNMECTYDTRFAIFELVHFVDYNIQGDHKVFPRLQTLITKKLRGIQTYFFFQNVTQLSKVFYNTSVHFNMCSFCCTGCV